MIWGCAVSGVEPKSSYPFLILLGFLLLFPLSSDPLARIPPVRLALWPLAPRDRYTLRLLSLFLSPVLWLTLFLLLKTAPTLALFFLALAVAMQSVLSFSPRVPWVPPFPGLIRNNLRQMLSVLDPYLALVITVGGSIYRFATRAPDPAAFPVLAILVALALSTYAQCLFSLDSLTRYSLLPLPGWRILLAKDLAFLVILLPLVLPLDAIAGLTFGFTALAIGHWPSVSSRLPLHRWRFTGGRIKYGVAQSVLGAMLAVAGALGFVIALCAYLLSLYLCGKRFRRIMAGK